MSASTDDSRLSILFSLVHPGYLRNFDSSIRGLAERGHRVQLLFAHHRKAEDVGRTLLDEYATRYGIGYHVRSFPPTFWAEWARWIRTVRDYARYFQPEFSHAVKLRRRAAVGVPLLIQWLFLVPGVGRVMSGRVFTWILTRAEAAIPANRAIVGYLRHCRINLLMVSPLVELLSPQTEYVKAARALGIRTVLPVASWDNLTNKGQIRVAPDLVAVWNDLQEKEAIRIHRIAPERIAVTGAEAYDHWFTWRQRSRDEFCTRIGLDPARPYFLYVGSSRFISGDETAFTTEWIERLRAARDPVLRTAGVLIRPHPQNVRCWERFDTGRFADVVVYPRHGTNPLNAEDKQDYFDSIFHSAASIGINTSALIESAILQREVFTVLDDRFKETQEGTLHFHYLVDPQFGFLRVARSLDEHLDQLTRALQPDDQVRVRAKRFVETFIRPRGVHTAATPLLIAAIERLGNEPVARMVKPFRVAVAVSTLPALVAWTIAGISTWLVDTVSSIDLASRSSSLPKFIRRRLKQRRRQRSAADGATAGDLRLAK